MPWAIFHTGDNPDGTQTLIAGNPAAYLGYLLALGALAVLGAMWHDRTARTPRFRILVAAVAAAAVALFVLAATTGDHDNRDSDPIPSRVDGLSTRLWYLRRGVAWLPLLGACVAAAVTAVLLARWPDDAFLLAPALLACCAAAAAFVYDEDALPVVAVTPRGAGWRRANRLGVTLVPLSVWALVVALRPGDVPFWRPGWWLLGGATVLLVAGSAALASRRLVPTPGALLAPVVALAAVAPVTLVGDVQLGHPLPDRRLPRPRANGVAGGGAQRRRSLCAGAAARTTPMRTTAVRRSAAREPGSPRTVGSPVPGAAMLVIGGGICGLAWAAGLRGFMAQITVESNVSWSGTFGYVLLPGLAIGMLLGWAEHVRRTGGRRGWRWLALSPLLFAAVLFSEGPLEVLGIFEDGIGGGALGLPLYAMAGGFALSGRGPGWARALCGGLALTAIPIWALTVESFGGPDLAVTTARGLWVAIYYYSFLAVASLAAAIPHRATDAAP